MGTASTSPAVPAEEASPPTHDTLTTDSPLLMVAGEFPCVSILDPDDLDVVYEFQTPHIRNRRISCLCGQNTVLNLLVASEGLERLDDCNHASSGLATYEISENRPLSTFRDHHHGHVMGVHCLSSSGTFDYVPRIVSGSHCSDLFVWNAVTGETIARLPDGPGSTLRIASFPEWSHDEVFVAGTRDTMYVRAGAVDPGYLYLYNLEKNARIRTYEGHEIAVYGVAAEISRSIVVSVGFRKQLRFFSYESGRCENVAKLPSVGCSVLCCCPEEDENLIVVGGRSVVSFFDLRKWDECMAMCHVPVADGKFIWDVCRIGPPGVFAGVLESVEDNVVVFTSESLLRKTTLPGVCFGCTVVGGEFGGGGANNCSSSCGSDWREEVQQVGDRIGFMMVMNVHHLFTVSVCVGGIGSESGVQLRALGCFVGE